MPTEPEKPLIVISYAHADEPEHPAEGEVKWLSFVIGYLRPAIKHGAVDLWLDRLMPGGADWEREIERKLRDCDIFILLVSPNSLASDDVIKKEIAIIRERQAKGEDMHFYPLLLTPTPNIALDLMREKNLRPRGGKPFSDYSLHDRDRHMSETADAIAQIAAEIVARKRAPWRSPPAAPLARLSSAPPPSPRQRADKRRMAKPEINDQESLEAWLEGQSLEVAAAIAARTALRVAPLTFRDARKARSAKEVSAFLVLTSVVFRASALARVAAKYPARANELNAAALVAAARAAAAVAAGAAAGGWASASAACVLAAAADAADAALAAPFAIPLAGPARPSFPAAWAAADWAVREEMCFDASALQKLGVRELADFRLWSRSAAEWVEGAWQGLKLALPEDEGWDVWIDWYEERLRGGSRGEAHELIFVSTPLDVWDKGPAAANAWIKSHLPGAPSRAALSPSAPRIATLRSR